MNIWLPRRSRSSPALTRRARSLRDNALERLYRVSRPVASECFFEWAGPLPPKGEPMIRDWRYRRGAQRLAYEMHCGRTNTNGIKA